MKYRTRLLLMLLAIVAVSNGTLFALMYVQSRGALLDAIRSAVTSVAATTAALLDGDLHKQIRTRPDENSPAYASLESSLRKARDANRRGDLQIKYLTTMFHAPADRSTVQFGVDPEESPKDKSHVGDVYHARLADSKAEFNLDDLHAHTDFLEDQWGTWLSARAPLKDSSGNVVAAVAADLDARDVKRQVATLFWSGLTAVTTATAAAVALALFLSRRVSKPLHELKNAATDFGAGNLDRRVPPSGCAEFDEVARAFNSMADAVRERQTLKEVLARYLSRSVAETIMSSGQMPTLKGDRRKITVLFADIRNFTKMSDAMPPEQVVAVLNAYFEKMIDIIFKHRGTLDKFIGDGLMAVFGAPLDDPYQEEHAVAAAVEMQQALEELCATLRQQYNVDLRIGIGINTGMAVVGNIGSTQRMEYTAIGDTVNLASRLEAQTKSLGVNILVSEYTYVEIRNKFLTKEIGSIEIRGRAGTLPVYAIESRHPTPPQPTPLAA